MADLFVDGKVIIVADNRIFENGHHLSLLQKDVVEFFGDVALQLYMCRADELTLCLWKASALRSSPVEGGCIVAANVLRNLSAVATLETSYRSVTSSKHSYADTKFMPVFCCAYYSSVLGLFNQEHVVFRLCAKVPTIERVVLRAQTAEAFRLASEEAFRTQLREFMTKRMLLCSEGCNFGICRSPFASHDQTEFWEQLYVVSCIPACQGRLTETSEIVLKCDTQTKDMSLSCPRKHSYNNGYSIRYDADAEAVMVSDFAADIANKHSFLTSQKLDICLSKPEESMPYQVLNCKILMDVERVKSLMTFKQSLDVSDEFSVAVFSRQCASRLGIMNGNILELSCMAREQHQCESWSFADNHQHSCRQKLVIACIDTTHSDADVVVCISSCTWFNLCSISCMSLSGSCNIQPCYVKVCLLRVY